MAVMTTTIVPFKIFVDSDTDENQSNCSSESLRRIKVFVEDERDRLNTEITVTLLIEEIDDLEHDIHTAEELSTLKKFRRSKRRC